MDGNDSQGRATKQGEQEYTGDHHSLVKSAVVVRLQFARGSSFARALG